MTVKEKQKDLSNQQIAYDFFLGNGYSPEASSAIVGNLLHESGLNTSIEGDKGYSGGSSFGIAQWRGERLKRLKNEYGSNWNNLSNQLQFVKQELETTHSSANQVLKNTRDLHKAAQAFSDLYERPAKKYLQDKNRQQRVTEVYKNYTGANLLLPNVEVTPEQKITNLESIPEIAKFEEVYSDIPQPKQQPVEVEKAKEQLVQKQAESDLIEYLKESDYRVAPQPIAPTATLQTPNILQRFSEISNFVSTPIYQEGGQVQQSQEWLQNWYENRQIVDPAIQAAYNEDKPYFTELSQFIPNPTVVDIIDPNSPEIKGQYDPETNEIKVIEGYKPSTYLHEATHRTQNFNSAMRPIHRDLVNQNVRLTGDYLNDSEYYTDPDEIHARIQVLRNAAGIQPTQTVTPEYLRSFINSYQGTDGNINDLIELTDEQGLLNLLNNMAYNPNQQPLYYAQQGGQIPVSSLGMYQYPNQPVIVPTKNGTITMSQIDKPIRATSMETGESKILLPNLEYFFSNTQNVFETPLQNGQQRNFK